MRKGARESQRQIDLNYGFTHSSSERGMKPVCVNFITFQTFGKTISKNGKYTSVKLLGCGHVTETMCNTFSRSGAVSGVTEKRESELGFERVNKNRPVAIYTVAPKARRMSGWFY